MLLFSFCLVSSNIISSQSKSKTRTVLTEMTGRAPLKCSLKSHYASCFCLLLSKFNTAVGILDNFHFHIHHLHFKRFQNNPAIKNCPKQHEKSKGSSFWLPVFSVFLMLLLIVIVTHEEGLRFSD